MWPLFLLHLPLLRSSPVKRLRQESSLVVRVEDRPKWAFWLSTNRPKDCIPRFVMIGLDEPEPPAHLTSFEI